VWARLDAGATQQAVADGIGWSRAQVSQYAMLKNLADEAWKVVATGFSFPVATDAAEDVATIATGVASQFSENLLRNILPLRRKQQIELCRALAGEMQLLCQSLVAPINQTLAASDHLSPLNAIPESTEALW
jgi:hypothetical protein